MKTVYIPKGETVTYDSLYTDRLVVNGSLNVTRDIRVKTISGKGFIRAETIHADTIQADEIEADTIVCDKLLAKRVLTSVLGASDSIVVSCYLSSDYVSARKLTTAANKIGEVAADQVYDLPAKKRGMLCTLFLSALRALWVSLTAPRSDKAAKDAKKRHTEPTALEKTNLGPDLVAVTEMDQEPAGSDETDFELKRLVTIFKLLRDSGYTLRVLPGTPEENAPVFDSETQQFFRPAA